MQDSVLPKKVDVGQSSPQRSHLTGAQKEVGPAVNECPSETRAALPCSLHSVRCFFSQQPSLAKLYIFKAINPSYL